MNILKRAQNLNWRVIGAALISVGILHICATLAMPELAPSSAYERLAGKLPANVMKVLPPLSPENQPLPFMPPEFRYAMCRIDASKGPVVFEMRLPDRGWALSVYSTNGDNLYAATGQLGRPADISLQIVSSDERFTGLTPEARGRPRSDQPAVTVGAREGIIVVRAPEKGLAYRTRIEEALETAKCQALSY